MRTVLSCEHEAMYDVGSPMLGAHETSRTQSVCLSIVSSTNQPSGESSVASLNAQILTLESHPPVTKRFCFSVAAGPPAPGALFLLLLGRVSEPGMMEGAQETEVAPMGWAVKVWWEEDPSLLKETTEILESEEAQARIGPSS